jgi:hypothetical protein
MNSELIFIEEVGFGSRVEGAEWKAAKFSLIGERAVRCFTCRGRYGRVNALL